jgi:cation:H+ antiporter
MMWIFLALGIGLMTLGADWVVGGSSRISRHFHISQFVVSAFIIGIGGNIPETTITFLSAGTDLETMIMPMMVTSNIVNILGLIAIFALISPIYLNSIPMREIKILLASSALLVVMLYDGKLDWVEGCGLLAIFIYYSLGTRPRATHHDVVEPHNWCKTIFLVLFGTALIYSGSHFFLESVKMLVDKLNLSGSALGALIVAPGTSGPEIVVSTLSILRKKPQILVGNMVGSCISHIILLSGIAGILTEPTMTFKFDTLLMLFATILFCFDIAYRKKITRISGILYLGLLGLYFATILV